MSSLIRLRRTSDQRLHCLCKTKITKVIRPTTVQYHWRTSCAKPLSTSLHLIWPDTLINMYSMTCSMDSVNAGLAKPNLLNFLRTFLDHWQRVSKLILFYLILVKPSTRWITSNCSKSSGYMVFKVMSWIGSSPSLEGEARLLCWKVTALVRY